MRFILVRQCLTCQGEARRRLAFTLAHLIKSPAHGLNRAFPNRASMYVCMYGVLPSLPEASSHGAGKLP